MPQRQPFEPRSLNDPVACLTAWTPCKSGGMNICTHKLARRGPDRVAFRPTIGACAYYGVILLSGGAVAVEGLRGLIIGLASGAVDNPSGAVLGIIVGLVVAVLGARVMWSGTRSITFDRRLGMFWKGGGAPRKWGGTEVELQDIHALQVVSERCSGDESSFWSYELNLVLVDGSRVTVVDHRGIAQLRRDAAVLAGFLGVPLWDPA